MITGGLPDFPWDTLAEPKAKAPRGGKAPLQIIGGIQ